MGRWATCALLLVLLLPLTAFGQSPSAQDRATARLLAEEADKKVEAGDLKGALELFRRADAIFPAPSLKVAIAGLLVKQQQLIEAHELFLDVARSEPQPGEPAVWASARETARQEAEGLALRIPRIEISLQGLSPKIPRVVTLDGQRIPNESIGVLRPINPGVHLVRAEAEGFLPAEQKIQMAEGEHYKLTLKLYPEPSPSKDPAPSATADTSPPPRPPPKPRPGNEDNGGRSLALIGFTGAGVFLGTGAILGWMVSSRVDDIKKDCTLPGGACPLSRRSDADTAERLAIASNLSFGLAAAGLGFGLYGLLSDSQETSATKSLMLRVGVGLGSVALGGRF
ncbi:MAG: hypothetical protein RMJ98_19535 [Myxococcales bacterium]|nr:hypothetical protein [Polyangiaceae bacterium]MDW8251493.1 hypothetical protein [Myxococcales bacterium]